MIISVLSGKGGTGKTLISVNLAAVLDNVQYLDCDVEEPNGFIFLKPQLRGKEAVKVKNPIVDIEKCLACGQCVKACQFNSLALVKEKVIIFSKLCHSCGACLLVCPAQAITEIDREIGFVEEGTMGDLACYQGKLQVGEPMAIPIIKQLKTKINGQRNVILDCPPGSSCSVVNSIEGSDYCILVTEPTPFGFHDLQIAVSLVRKMGIPFGVIINKNQLGSNIILNYCQKEEIQILGAIPFSKEIARIYSEGKLLANHGHYWNRYFRDLAHQVGEVIGHETVSCN